ncbi:MAG: CARDB domain-containing protein, partial [Candidatus Dormibacteria bacterium]
MATHSGNTYGLRARLGAVAATVAVVSTMLMGAAYAAGADLQLTNSADKALVPAGSTGASPQPGDVKFSIVLTNIGDAAASTVTITTRVPDNTTYQSLTSPSGWACTPPSMGQTGDITCANPTTLAAAGRVTFDLIVRINAMTPSGTVITNTARVTSTPADTNTANNTATAITTVQTADLTITNTGSPSTVNAGSNITYTIVVRNSGDAAASNVVLSSSLPATTAYQSITSPAGWACTTPLVNTSGALSCTRPTLAVGGGGG